MTIPGDGRDSDVEVLAVMRGYMALDSIQRQKFIEILNEFNRNDSAYRTEFRRKATRVSLGPLGFTCPCCGR